MLQRSLEIGLLDRIGLAPIVEKMVESYPSWFRHVERRPVAALVRRVDHLEESLVVRGS